jgi:hypothetical protein
MQYIIVENHENNICSNLMTYHDIFPSTLLHDHVRLWAGFGGTPSLAAGVGPCTTVGSSLMKHGSEHWKLKIDKAILFLCWNE